MLHFQYISISERSSIQIEIIVLASSHSTVLSQNLIGQGEGAGRGQQEGQDGGVQGEEDDRKDMD